MLHPTYLIAALAAFVPGGFAPLADGEQGAEAKPQEPAAKPRESTLDKKGEFDSIWQYLQAKYDTNKDGKVQPEEYQRKSANFPRLDRNRDGVLTAVDFDPQTTAAPDPADLSRVVVAYYFQEDEDADSVSAEEVELAFLAYDENLDGEISSSEFSAQAEERCAHGKKPRLSERRLLEGTGAYASLVAHLDKNNNESVGGDELLGFFREYDADGDLVWDVSRKSARAERPEGPAAGEPAPDFELALLGSDKDGGEETRVSLSSFQGKKPVALIFGSYT